MSYQAAWQNEEHSQQFGKAIRKKNAVDFLRKYNRYMPARCLNYLINTSSAPGSILDVGCAGGDVYAYLSYVGKSTDWSYKGLDISEPAINLAGQHYGENLFQLIEADNRLGNERADIVVSIDVLIHHLDPYAHLEDLLNCSKKYTILALRTRESGDTVLNPDLSCQRNYGEWVPFIVFNSKELYQKIAAYSDKPVKISSFKEYQVLGGKGRRFLPKELYDEKTRSAVTTLIVEKCDSNVDGQVDEYHFTKSQAKHKKPLGFKYSLYLYEKNIFRNYILDRYTEKIEKIDDIYKFCKVDEK